MKVGFIVPKLSGGGAEYIAQEWASYLADAKVDVYILATQAVEGSPDNRYRLVVIPEYNLLRKVKYVRALVAEMNLDIVIGVMPYWNLLAMIAAKSRLGRKAKVVVSSHTIESAYGAERGRGFVVQTWLAGWVYRFADAFLASSHPVAAEAVAKYAITRERLWVVPNPVFPSSVRRLCNSDGMSSKASGVAEVLIVPGRLVDQKRPELAIEVATAIGRQLGSSPAVWFIGEGPAAESLAKKATAAGVDAKFVAWDANWTSLVPPAAVVLLPSMLEGFGNVLLDAAAAGLPVVASSKALGVADAMIPGVTGALVIGESVRHYVDGVLAVRGTYSGYDPVVDRWLNRFTKESSGAHLLSVISTLTSTDRT